MFPCPSCILNPSCDNLCINTKNFLKANISSHFSEIKCIFCPNQFLEIIDDYDTSLLTMICKKCKIIYHLNKNDQRLVLNINNAYLFFDLFLSTFYVYKLLPIEYNKFLKDKLITIRKRPLFQIYNSDWKKYIELK